MYSVAEKMRILHLWSNLLEVLSTSLVFCIYGSCFNCIWCIRIYGWNHSYIQQRQHLFLRLLKTCERLLVSLHFCGREYNDTPMISLECVVNSDNFPSTLHIVEHELNLGFLCCHHSSSSHHSWLCEVVLREHWGQRYMGYSCLLILSIWNSWSNCLYSLLCPVLICWDSLYKEAGEGGLLQYFWPFVLVSSVCLIPVEKVFYKGMKPTWKCAVNW